MMARAHLVNPSVTRWYHCAMRCVRRAFLLTEERGEDPLSRKEWIEHRLTVENITRWLAQRTCTLHARSGRCEQQPRNNRCEPRSDRPHMTRAILGVDPPSDHC